MGVCVCVIKKQVVATSFFMSTASVDFYRKLAV
jgi:hypothetical protein